MLSKHVVLLHIERLFEAIGAKKCSLCNHSDAPLLKDFLIDIWNFQCNDSVFIVNNWISKHFPIFKVVWNGSFRPLKCAMSLHKLTRWFDTTQDCLFRLCSNRRVGVVLTKQHEFWLLNNADDFIFRTGNRDETVISLITAIGGRPTEQQEKSKQTTR